MRELRPDAQEEVPVEGSPKWSEQRAAAILKEEELQRRVADSPHLLREAGVLDPTAVATELPVPDVGPADVVLVDAEGTITIVECKLAANPEIRRWVIGQVTSYAAGLWRLDFENFERRFDNCGAGLTAPLAGVPGWSEEIFRGNVTKNLQAGTFKLIIAVDQVTRELVRTLVWLNSHTVSDVRVLAAGLHQVADDGVTMLPPMVFGDEYVDRVPPRIPRPRPSRKLLVDGIAARSTFDAGAAEAVLDWAESKHPRLRIRYTPKDGVIETEAGETLLRIVRHSEVRVSPDNFADRWSDEQTEELLRDYEDLELRLEGTKLRAPLEALTDEGRRTRFLEQVLETLTT